MKTVDEMIDEILLREGGFVNHKADPGGATNFGVTIGVYSEYLGRSASVADVKEMSKQTARDIFNKLYYERPRLRLLPHELQPQLFDCAINHGSKNPMKWLQKITNQALEAGLAIDGMLGNKTATAVKKLVDLAGGKVANNAMVEERVEFYLRIIQRKPSQKVFKRGWIIRAKGFEQ